MTDGAERGVAYNFWLRVQGELADRGWTDVELQRRSGIPRTTVSNLKVGKRAPTRRVVNAVADALGIDREEAHRLARGLPGAPAPGTASVREAVKSDPNYTEQQRRAMLDLLDIFEQANRQGEPDEERRAAG